MKDKFDFSETLKDKLSEARQIKSKSRNRVAKSVLAFTSFAFVAQRRMEANFMDRPNAV